MMVNYDRDGVTQRKKKYELCEMFIDDYLSCVLDHKLNLALINLILFRVTEFIYTILILHENRSSVISIRDHLRTITGRVRMGFSRIENCTSCLIINSENMRTNAFHLNGVSSS